MQTMFGITVSVVCGAQTKLSDFVDSLAGEKLTELAAEAPQEDRIQAAKGQSLFTQKLCCLNHRHRHHHVVLLQIDTWNFTTDHV